MKTGALLSGTDPRAIKVIVATSIGDRFTIGVKKEKIDVRLAFYVLAKVRAQLYLSFMKKKLYVKLYAIKKIRQKIYMY